MFLLKGENSYQVEISDSPQGQAQRFDNAVNSIAKKLEDAKRRLEDLAVDKAALEQEIEKPNPYDKEIRMLNMELRKVSQELGLDE